MGDVYRDRSQARGKALTRSFRCRLQLVGRDGITCREKVSQSVQTAACYLKALLL